MNDATPSLAAEVAAPSRAAFAFIFVTVLLDMMAIGIVIPVLPGLIVGFMGGDAAERRHSTSSGAHPCPGWCSA